MNYQEPHSSQPAYNPYAPPVVGTEQMAGVYEYGEDQILAGRGTRLLATIVDWLLYSASTVPGVVLAVASGGDDDALTLGVLAMAGGFFAFFAFQMYLVTVRGQSLGKKWLGLKIVKTDGTEAGFVHGVLLRTIVTWFIKQIPAVGLLAGLVDPLLIFGDERRCLHDMIAGTKVIIAD